MIEAYCDKEIAATLGAHSSTHTPKRDKSKAASTMKESAMTQDNIACAISDLKQLLGQRLSTGTSILNE